MTNRNKERRTKTSGCEISDDDIGLRMSIRNSYSDFTPPSLLIDASSSLPCLYRLITCFRFQNMFRKNISCFRFWGKITRYVTSRVKSLASPAFCSWSSAFKFRYDSENERTLCEQKHWIKIYGGKIPILVLFCFGLLNWLYLCLYCSCKFIGSCRLF